MSMPVTAVIANEGRKSTSAIRATMNTMNSTEAIRRMAYEKRCSRYS